MSEILKVINKRLDELDSDFKEVKESTRVKKRFMAVNDNKKEHFGQPGAKTYLDLILDGEEEKAEDKKERYRLRHSKIKTKDGRYAFKIKDSPAYLSYNLLW